MTRGAGRILRRGLVLLLLYYASAIALYLLQDFAWYRRPEIQPYAAALFVALSAGWLALLARELGGKARATRLVALSFLVLAPLARDHVLYGDEFGAITNTVTLLLDPFGITFFNYGILTQLVSLVLSGPVVAAGYVAANGLAIPAASELSHGSGGAGFRSLLYFNLHLASILLLSVTPVLAHRVCLRLHAGRRWATGVCLLTLGNVALAQHAALFLPHPFLAPLALLMLLVVTGTEARPGPRAGYAPAAVAGAALGIFPASYPLSILLAAVLVVRRRSIGWNGALGAAAVYAGCAFLADPLVVVNKLLPGYVPADTGLEWIVPAKIEAFLSRSPVEYVRAVSRLGVQLGNGLGFVTLAAALGGAFAALARARRRELGRAGGFLLFFLAVDLAAKIALNNAEIRFLFSSVPVLLLLVPYAVDAAVRGKGPERWSLVWGGLAATLLVAPDVVARVVTERHLGFDVPGRSAYLAAWSAVWAGVFLVVFLTLAALVRGRRGTAIFAVVVGCGLAHFVWFQAESFRGSHPYRLARHLVLHHVPGYAYVSPYPEYVTQWTPRFAPAEGRPRAIGPATLAGEDRLALTSAYFTRIREAPPDKPVVDEHTGETVRNGAYLEFYTACFQGDGFAVERRWLPPPNLFDGVGVHHTFPYLYLLERVPEAR